MPALHDGTANLSAHLTAATTQTISGKLASGADRLGRVAASVAGTGWDSLISAKWDGVDLTEVGSASGGGRTVKLFRIVNPPESASDIVFEFSAPVAMGYIASSYNGVDQDTPCENTITATGSGPTASVTITSAAGNLVIDAVTCAGPSVAPIDITQEGSDVTDGGSYTMGAGRDDGAASVVMSWDLSSSVAWAIIATSLRASGGGGGPTPDAIASSQPRFPRWMARLRG